MISSILFPQHSQEQSLHHQGPDPNSPDLFKQNIQLVQAHVVRLQTLATSALSGVQNAYHSGSNPTQTVADIASLRHILVLLGDIMRHSGVGALPLLPLPTPESMEPISAPTEQNIATFAAKAEFERLKHVKEATAREQKMIADATLAVQAEFERLKNVQEAAAIASNVLSTSTH